VKISDSLTEEKIMKTQKCGIFVLVLFWGTASLFAANHFVRSGAAGSATGADWTNASTNLPTALTRGDTYYVADGNYTSHTFADAESGNLVITIKKATKADHGTDIGWQDSYGSGQAVLGSLVSITKGFYVIDGNGTNMIPNNHSENFGFKIASASTNNWGGIIALVASNVTLRFMHVYNASNGDVNNGTVGLRYTGDANYIKVQNCLLENCGKDGIQISKAKFLLFENNYIKRYGMLRALSPDYHGQTVQMFYGGSDIIFRNNVWESNEGQGLVSFGASNTTNSNFRFYGNVVFVPTGTRTGYGFNGTGGLIGNGWTGAVISNFYVYNNTFVNINKASSMSSNNAASFFMRSTNTTSMFTYNNLYYNCENVAIGTAWTAGYMAAGGLSAPGQPNEQTGLSSGIFADYAGNNFSLALGTSPGLILAAQDWWDSSADSFFGQRDSSIDMSGKTRGADGVWDRGAFEYRKSTLPAAPSGLRRVTP
jgi:hypothetical protein